MSLRSQSRLVVLDAGQAGAVNPKAVAGIVGVLTNFYNIKPEQVKIIYN